MHLFHDTKKYKFFDQAGKLRPPNRPRSPYTKETWLNSTLPHADNDLPSDLYVITEQWENQDDFAYLSDHYVHNTVNTESNMVTAAIKAQKAKFRVPKHDQSAPDIVDTRSDEEKMQDILWVWSQVLTPMETAIWKEVSQRDLSKDISLKYGLRTPKYVIDWK